MGIFASRDPWRRGHARGVIIQDHNHANEKYLYIQVYPPRLLHLIETRNHKS